MAKYKTFIVHLKRAAGRKAQVQDLIDKSPYPSEIVNAVDGKLLSKEDIETSYSEKSFLQPNYPFGMNAGEIGCFQSHRLAWQRIVDQDLTAGLVLEDDVQIAPDVFEATLKAAEHWSDDFGYIQFQVRGVPENCDVVSAADNVKLVQPSPTLLRCSAQLITRPAAKHLLQMSKKFDRPVDAWLQMHWVTGIRPICVVPSGVTDRTQETGGSNLSIKISLISKFSREWNRMRYRQNIVRYSNMEFEPKMLDAKP